MTTTIIKTDKVELQSNSWLVAFIYPDTKPKQVKYVSATSEFDIDRRLILLHRNYISEKLSHWLNQRAVARRDSSQTIANLGYAIDRLKLGSLTAIAKYVHEKRADFEGIAPTKDVSKSMPHYKNIIIPILEYCSGYHLASSSS